MRRITALSTRDMTSGQDEPDQWRTYLFQTNQHRTTIHSPGRFRRNARQEE